MRRVPELKSIAEHRALLINDKNFKEVNQWMLEYNYDVRDEALREFRKKIKNQQNTF